MSDKQYKYKTPGEFFTVKSLKKIKKELIKILKGKR